MKRGRKGGGEGARKEAGEAQKLVKKQKLVVVCQIASADQLLFMGVVHPLPWQTMSVHARKAGISLICSSGP